MRLKETIGENGLLRNGLKIFPYGLRIKGILSEDSFFVLQKLGMESVSVVDRPYCS